MNSPDTIAETYFRPGDAEIAKRHAERFPAIDLFRVTDPKMGLGDWSKIQTDFFTEGGVFDQIYQSGR